MLSSWKLELLSFILSGLNASVDLWVTFPITNQFIQYCCLLLWAVTRNTHLSDWNFLKGRRDMDVVCLWAVTSFTELLDLCIYWNMLDVSKGIWGKCCGSFTAGNSAVGGCQTLRVGVFWCASFPPRLPQTPGTPAFTLAPVLALQARGQPAQEKVRAARRVQSSTTDPQKKWLAVWVAWDRSFWLLTNADS